MFCKNLLKRQRASKIVYFCKSKRGYIDYRTACQNCLEFILVRNKPIRNITNKQKQLNKNRFSNFTDNFEKCYWCKNENGKMDLHEVYGGSNRTRSIKNGFVVPLCRVCHNNEDIIQELRILIQKEYELNHSRQEFIDIFGKSYIKE